MRILRGSITDFKDLLGAPFFDLIFIDGAHDYFSVVNDIRVSLRGLKPGGILCGHDFCPNSGKEVADAVRQLIFSNPAIRAHGVVEDTTIWYGVYQRSTQEESMHTVESVSRPA
jgi:predicted O-methyltransferase YrrM